MGFVATVYNWLDTIDLKVTVLLLTVWFLASRYIRRPRDLPPGPPNLPLMGSLPFLGSDLLKELDKLRRKYGDVFTIYMGNMRVVVINGYDRIKETMGDISFSGRPWKYVEDVFNQGRGIFSSSGEPWVQQRRFAHVSLKDLGIEKTFHEESMKEEIHYLLQKLVKKEGQPFSDITEILGRSVSNIIARLCFGHNFQVENHVEKLRESFELTSQLGILTFFPILKYFPGDLFKHKRMVQIARERQEAYQKIVQEHKATYDEYNPRDFVDVYLKKLKVHMNDPKSTFNEIWLVQVLDDLFAAGFDTIVQTLRWGLLFLLHHPEVHRKVQIKIDTVLGESRSPTYNDRSQLPYTMATLSEIQRLGDVVPIFFHQTTEEVIHGGYRIPARTTVLPNLNGVHHDPKYWDKPDLFNPERFLDTEGKYKKIDQLIPFSIGKRVCLGESLARRELFLFFTSMLHQFTFLPPEGEPLPPIVGNLGITYAAKHYHLRALKRYTRSNRL